MSIYSGFSTRQTQESYNNLLLKAISLTQNKLIEFINKQEKDISIFCFKFIRIIKKLKDYQQRKYLPPKFTLGFEQLTVKLENFLKDLPDQNVSIDLTEKSQMIPSLQKQPAQLKRQNPNFQRSPKNKEMAPVELPPKYKLIYNSQTNKKISKSEKPRGQEEDSKSFIQRSKRNITLNEFESRIPPIQRNGTSHHPPRLHEARNLENYERTSHQLRENPMTFYSNNQQLRQQRQFGPKGIIKYKQVSHRNKESKRTFLDTIKQRIRTQQINNNTYNSSNNSKQHRNQHRFVGNQQQLL